MGDIISLDEYRQQKLGSQFDVDKKKKKKANKQVIRERRENEIDDTYKRHPSKRKFKEDE
jgi:hypothetical protein